MKLVGILPVRNEAWCLGLTARAALMWCDELVIYLHSCSDKSAAIIREVANETGRVNVIAIDVSREWDEMRHRQNMLIAARTLGATHVAIVDADEILTGNLADSMHFTAEVCPSNSILQLPGYNMRGARDVYHSNGIWGNRWFSVVFADDPRLHWTGDQFHHREPMGANLKPYRPIAQGQGGVMHLWAVSERRLVAKHALYALTERLRWPGKPTQEINAMYGMSMYGTLAHPAARWTFKEAPTEWWAPYEPWLNYLDIDAEPWQEAETRRLIEEHGANKFHGLDLFGVA